MRHRRLLGFVTLVLTFAQTLVDAQAWDDSKYPDLKGQWRRTESGDPTRFDPSKPAGLGQQAPLTPEYQARFEAGLKDIAAGGPGLDFFRLPGHLLGPSRPVHPGQGGS